MKLQLQEEQITICLEKEMMSDDIFQYFHIAKKVRYAYYSQHRVFCNGEVLHQNTPINATDWITILPIVEEDHVFASKEEIRVEYEDELFLIVYKPVGIIIHSDGTSSSTLDQRVKGYYEKKHIQSPVRAIHRLDKDTSGLVIYCKVPFFQPYLDYMLEEKQISRIYLAIVSGIVKQKQVIIQKPLGRDRHNAMKMRVSVKGMSAYTKVIRKKTMQDISLVECHLKTGRTHQIRVHMAAIGHPLLSDSLYGTKDNRISRCALHAWKLRFYHPICQEIMELTCEMPNDMLQLIKQKES